MSNLNKMIHYYGDTVRGLFIAGAIFMVATLPFVAKFIAVPFLISILGILIVIVAAGITSPKFLWSSILNIFIALHAVVQFEWYSVTWYLKHGAYNSFFWVNQTLAIIFLIALYYAVKTFRGVRAELLDEKTTSQSFPGK